jgi:hypothetical protein
MIIVLKNADFSQSNIGTLSTWRISRSLSAGATYEGATSVDKGAAFSATVTLAEGYEIGAAGVTITMGGTVLSGAHSISGNVITITIAEVTGNVLIKVPTVNTAGGDEPEEPDTPVVPDTPDVPEGKIEGKNLLTSWTEGYVVSDSATPKGDPYPLEAGACSDFVSLEVGTSYILDIRGETTHFPIFGYFYDSNKTNATRTQLSSYIKLETGIYQFTPSKPYVRFNKYKDVYEFALMKEADYIKDAPENYVPVGEFIEVETQNTSEVNPV